MELEGFKTVQLLPTFVRSNVTFRFSKLVLCDKELQFNVFVSENGNLVQSRHCNYEFVL